MIPKKIWDNFAEKNIAVSTTIKSDAMPEGLSEAIALTA
jgi:hypothetical protein